MDPEFEVEVTVMIDDGTVVETKRAGCRGACHDDAIGMASAPPDKEITKYFARSRSKVTRQGGGENYKPDADIDKMLQDGVFREFRQARLNKGAAAGQAQRRPKRLARKSPSSACSWRTKPRAGSRPWPCRSTMAHNPAAVVIWIALDAGRRQASILPKKSANCLIHVKAWAENLDRFT